MHTQSLSLPDAARRLGGEVRGVRIYFPGPGHDPGDRSAWAAFDPHAPDGIIAGTFSPRDDWRAIKDQVREALGLERERPIPNRQPQRRTVEIDNGQDQRTRNGLAIFRSARELRGTIAERYLRSRGLDTGENLAHVLRFHPAMKFDARMVPAMVALMRDIRTNEPCGIHRTFLDGAGRKIDRKMLGRAKGAAIKLDPHEDVTLGLHIGEGVETCLAARQLGYRPAWALGSAGAIATFPVLAGIEAITVFAENDAASDAAAEKCAETYENAGCEAWVIEPPSGDLNDFIRRAA